MVIWISVCLYCDYTLFGLEGLTTVVIAVMLYLIKQEHHFYKCSCYCHIFYAATGYILIITYLTN